jgi:hypothetical protein
VLDYQNVASDLLPTVAAAYALKFMGQVRGCSFGCLGWTPSAWLLAISPSGQMACLMCYSRCTCTGSGGCTLPWSTSACPLLQGAMADYRKFEEGRDQGDFSLLPELHASLSCLKVHLATLSRTEAQCHAPSRMLPSASIQLELCCIIRANIADTVNCGQLLVSVTRRVLMLRDAAVLLLCCRALWVTLCRRCAHGSRARASSAAASCAAATATACCRGCQQSTPATCRMLPGRATTMCYAFRCSNADGCCEACLLM